VTVRHTGVVKADIVVIGAGALGLSTALHCAMAGRSVLVVERATAGSQASGRAAGLFKSVQADELRTVLARRSIVRAIRFADWSGVSLDVARTGSFLIARTGEHQAVLRAAEHQSLTWGVNLREAAPGELAARVPYYQGDGAELALWCPEDIYIEEPINLVLAYLTAGRRHGVELLEAEPVTGILTAGGKVAGVETVQRSITAAVVVDAAGAWTRQVAELAGANVAVAPIRHQLVITEPSDEIAASDPIVRITDAAVYLRPARGGMMLGGFEPDPLPLDPRSEPPTFSTDDVPLHQGTIGKLADQVADQVPLASHAAIAELRGGLLTMSPDGRFVLGPVPDLPGLWVASGCNGSGLSCSPALGQALADWITGAPQRLDVSALAPGRFGAMTDAALVSGGVWQYAHFYGGVDES